MQDGEQARIGLALSGGGSRAMAFHLGCMRALHARGILSRIRQLSSVSGGSVIAAMYAYGDQPFAEFDKSVVQLLSKGLRNLIILELISPRLASKVIATNLVSRPFATAAAIFGRTAPFRRWSSSSDALESALRCVLSNAKLDQVARQNLEVIFNACELRTSTAFRFGNRISGSWRLGKIMGNEILVAHAVACSAAYPLTFPAFDRCYQFVRNGCIETQRVILTDGGVYDNLGLACLEPDRDSGISLHTPRADHIICCYAGVGQISGENIPYGFWSRNEAAFRTVFKKNQDWGLRRLHWYKQAGQIKGFVLPYLGQLDQALPSRVPNLVPRSEVIHYPTNFAPMTNSNIELISLRGEQLTQCLLDQYLPGL